MSTSRCYRAGKAGGVPALASRGSGGAICRLGPEQVHRPAEKLQRGPAAPGRVEDQRWALARVVVLIKDLVRVADTRPGVSMLPHRLGFFPPVAVHRGAERDQRALSTGLTQTRPAARPPRRPGTPGSAARTRRARTCGRPRPGPGAGAATPR